MVDAHGEPAIASPYSVLVVRARDRLRGLDRWDVRAMRITTFYLVAVLWLVVPGGLYIDDIRAQAYAVGHPFWPFIIESNHTHLSPGARTADWIMSNLWPLEHWPAVVLTLLIVAGLALAVWRLLRALVGPGPWALVGLALAIGNPALVPTTAWFRQTLTTTVSLSLTLGSAVLALNGIRSRKVGSLLASVGALALALMFSERAVVGPVLTLAVIVVAERGRIATRARRALWVVLGQAVAVVLFVVAYQSGSFDSATTGGPSVLGLVESTARSIGLDLVPALAGGPILWHPVPPNYAFARTPLWFAAAVGVVALSFVAALLRRRGAPAAAGRALILVAAYAVPIYVILYVGRISRATPSSVDDLRLFPDVAVMLAVALAMVMHGWHGRPNHGRPMTWAWGAAATVVLSLTAVSWFGFANQWHRSTTSGYFAALRSDLTANRGTVLPTPVPNDIVPGWVQPDFSTEALIRLLKPQTPMVLADSTPKVVSADGHLRTATFKTVSNGTRAVENFCGNALNPGMTSITIPLSKPAPYYRGAVVLLRILTTDSTQLTVSVVTPHGTLPAPVTTNPTLQRGPHTIYVPVPYGASVTAVAVSSSRSSAGVCLPSVAVTIPGAKRS